MAKNQLTPKFSRIVHSEGLRYDHRKYRSFGTMYLRNSVTPPIIEIWVFGYDIYIHIEFHYLHLDFHHPNYRIRKVLVYGSETQKTRSNPRIRTVLVTVRIRTVLVTVRIRTVLVTVRIRTVHFVNGDFRLRGSLYQALRKRRFPYTRLLVPRHFVNGEFRLRGFLYQGTS
jgi:hypothetical protein